jgi:hypothetical protein
MEPKWEPKRISPVEVLVITTSYLSNTRRNMLAYLAGKLAWERQIPRNAVLLPEAVHPCFYKGYPPTHQIIGEFVCVPRYDEDWAATGPLVEKYKITMMHEELDGWSALSNARDDLQFTWDESQCGATPLLAICHLLIALGKAGKL